MPQIIAGQGTLGLEILEDVPDVETVVVPVSGGGLAAGVAAAIKGLKSDHTSDRHLDGARRRDEGQPGRRRPVLVEELPTLADSLGGGIGLDNRLTFAMCRDLLDEVVLLSEDEIAAGRTSSYAEEREIVEGAGAVGIAALLAGKIELERADRGAAFGPQHRHGAASPDRLRRAERFRAQGCRNA